MNANNTPAAEPRYETRAVLAGAYRSAKAIAASTLTHLYDTQSEVVPPEGSEGVSMCRRAKNLADRYALSDEARAARPTCDRCAVKWDALVAAGEIVAA